MMLLVLLLLSLFLALLPAPCPVCLYGSALDHRAWMRSLPDLWKDRVRLRDMAIPGCHGACTGLAKSFYIGPLKDEGMCRRQSGPLSALIVGGGSRFFDIRIQWVDGLWVVVHGKCLFDLKFRDWLAEGLGATPGSEEEIFIFSIRTGGGRAPLERVSAAPIEAKRELLDHLFNTYNEHLVNTPEVVRVVRSTYRDLRGMSRNAAKPTCLFFLSSDLFLAYPYGFFPGAFIDEHYGDGWKVRDVESMRVYLEKAALDRARRHPHGLDVLQGYVQSNPESENLEAIVSQSFGTKEKICDFLREKFEEHDRKKYVNIVSFNFLPGVYDVAPTFVFLNNVLAGREFGE